MSENMINGFNINGTPVPYNYDSLGNKLEKTSIAREYSNIDTYDVDEYVIYNGKMYRCKQEILVGESFDSTKWTECSIGPELNYIKKFIGFSEDAKYALLNLLIHVAYTDEHGQDYYDELESTLFQTAKIVSLSAVFDQGSATVYDIDDLDTLMQYLTVTATYEDMSTREVTGYTLSGTLTTGTSTITVSYGGKTTTFDVTVSHAEELFVGASLGYGTLSKGTITFNSDGSVTMTTTGDSTNYNVCYSPYGSTNYFKTWQQLKGHTVRAVYSVTWANTTATSKVAWGPHLAATVNAAMTTRTAIHSYPNITSNADTYIDWVVPDDASGWNSSSSAQASDYFVYRVYLLSSTSGANVRLTVKFYDLGVVES